MDEILKALETNWAEFIMLFFLFLFSVKEIIEIFSYFKNKFRIKTGAEEDKDSLRNRIVKLEEYNIEISKDIKDIKAQLETQELKEKKRVIIEYGTSLYDLHSKFIKQGYVTRAGLETFQQLAEVYLDCDGDHLIKEKIIPEVYGLQICDEN